MPTSTASKRRAPASRRLNPPTLPKARTGIRGLDEITGGGLPLGRPTLIAGAAGCGKTLLAMEFLLRGATVFDEPGVFMAFEESVAELDANFSSLGHDISALIREQKLVVEHVHIERSEIAETGEYDLEGLFIRLGAAIDAIGAKRVVLDTLEALFAGLTNTAILRAELRRLFRWLKRRGVTAIITGERGEASITRYGLEEYVADCVIVLDHRVDGQRAIRRLRIVKYRGSSHGTSEYPFLIDEGGITLIPLTSLQLNHEVSDERVSSGLPDLDAMIGGRGYFRGSSVLLTGTAGSGKSTLAAHFIYAAVERGERCLWLAFEESPSQIIRNMRSVGLDFAPAIDSGLLLIHADRPSVFGLEMHLLTIHRLLRDARPQIVVVDPISAFLSQADTPAVQAMVVRLIDALKADGITALFTNLTPGGGEIEETEIGVSSLMDAWLVARDIEVGAERNRILHLIKSRGMAHSNQIREFTITNRGVRLLEPYLAPTGQLVLGRQRQLHELADREAASPRKRGASNAARRATAASKRRTAS